VGGRHKQKMCFHIWQCVAQESTEPAKALERDPLKGMTPRHILSVRDRYTDLTLKVIFVAFTTINNFKHPLGVLEKERLLTLYAIPLPLNSLLSI
jgi:hypothetical protein